MPTVRLHPEQREALARAAEAQRLAIPRFSQEEADEFDLQRNLQNARELELTAAQRLREIRDGATAERGFASEQAMADADRAIDEIRLTFLRDAPNAMTREMLAGVFDQRARVLRHELGAHVEREKFQAKIDVSTQRQAIAQQDAVEARTPLAFATNIQTAYDEIDRQAELTSQPPESVAARKARTLSTAHIGRFERLVDEGDLAGAGAYCIRHAREMSPLDRAQAMTVLAGRSADTDGTQGPAGGTVMGQVTATPGVPTPVDPLADPLAQSGSAVPAAPGQTVNGPAPAEAENEITVVGQKIARGTPSATAGKVNKITGARLDADEFVAELGQGWFAPLEPGPGGLNAEPSYERAVRKTTAVVAIANVDLLPDTEALAFIHKVSSTLSNAPVKDGRRAVEKYIMVEWDSSRSRYVVTGAKVIESDGGEVGDLKPVLPETLAAIRGKRPPRAFVIHTHLDGSYNGKLYSSLPGPGDGGIPKMWLIPNFTIEADSRKPKVFQTTLVAGQAKPRSRKPATPKVTVVQHFPDGRVRRLGRYENMPE